MLDRFAEIVVFVANCGGGVVVILLVCGSICGGFRWWRTAYGEEGGSSLFTPLVPEGGAVGAGARDQEGEDGDVRHKEDDYPPGKGNVEHVFHDHVIDGKKVSVFAFKLFGRTTGQALSKQTCRKKPKVELIFRKCRTVPQKLKWSMAF